MSLKENLIVNMDDSDESHPKIEVQKSCIYRTGVWILKQALGMSWIYPPVICIVVGSQISFKASLIAATIISYLSLFVSWLLYKCTAKESSFHPIAFPKLFEVFNPVAYSILLPIGFVAGEEFCRIWIGVITLGLLCFVIWGSIAIKKPWLSEAIPLKEDTRLHPMTWETRYWMTALFGVVFLIMFCSSLVVAIEELEFGTAFIIFNFVIPYSSLGLGIGFAPFIGKYIWIKSAKKHYGENWRMELFGDEIAGNDANKNTNEDGQTLITASD